jgi:hypothetical protein
MATISLVFDNLTLHFFGDPSIYRPCSGNIVSIPESIVLFTSPVLMRRFSLETSDMTKRRRSNQKRKVMRFL